MQKCFYHPPQDAAATCIGCKMPVCPTCHDDGKNGFDPVPGLSPVDLTHLKSSWVSA